ncbi:MAG: relaxase/mobilization nuclease domain-containing protein [Candidatus Pacearchaeota archaeon]
MILKSLSRKSGAAQLLQYLFQENKTSESQKPLIITHNIRSKSLDSWSTAFEENEQFRIHKRKDNIKVYHTVMSFSNKDKQQISNSKLTAIAQKYISLQGNDNLYVGTAHYDKDHIHLHLVMSGTKYLTGETNRKTKDDFHKLKLSMDAYQLENFPELTHSLPNHGKSKEILGKNHTQVIDSRNGRVSKKEKLLKEIETVYNQATSQESFLIELEKRGLTPYFRNGILTGVTLPNSLKFRLTRLGFDSDKLSLLNTIPSNNKEVLLEQISLEKLRSKQLTPDIIPTDQNSILESIRKRFNGRDTIER